VRLQVPEAVPEAARFRMNTEILNIRSGKVKRQILALGTLLESAQHHDGLMNIYASNELISAIVDYGICSDNG
jgi:hypothetical protein